MKNHKFNSWLGHIFPYVGMLEAVCQDQAEELDRKEELVLKLFDRLARTTTGYGLNQEMPDAITLEQQQRDLLGKPRTVDEMMLQMEAESEKRVKERYEQLAKEAQERHGAQREVSLEDEQAEVLPKVQSGRNGY